MIQIIRDMLHRDPFQPFRIITTSGDRYDITNPDLVAIGESVLFYCFPRSDRFIHIRHNQIVSVEAAQHAA